MRRRMEHGRISSVEKDISCLNEGRKMETIMRFNQWSVVALAALISVSTASAQTATPSRPPIANPNPASSATTDEEANNPLAREGENSPTGQGPSITTNPPLEGTVGSGAARTNQPKAHEK
jgi:hypothetical protein